MSRTALLIIDVQAALCVGGDAVFESEQVIARINQVAAYCHRMAYPVFVIQHETRDGAFAYGSDGWQTAPGLVTVPGDIRLRKRTPDAFNGTPLADELAARRVSTLIVCGLQSDFCVDTTTRRALALGFPVTLVSDGHSTVANGVLTAAQIRAHHNVTLSHITSFGPRVHLSTAAEIDRDSGAVA